MRGLACFQPRRGLRTGPAPLTLVSLGRWASIAAAAGNLSRGCRVFIAGPLRRRSVEPPRAVGVVIITGMDPLYLISPLTLTSSRCDQLRESTL